MAGMHAIKDRPVVVDGQIVIRPIMVVALTYDHRLRDGREAVTFLGASCACLLRVFRWLTGATILNATVKIKEYLEDPRKMLLVA